VVKEEEGRAENVTGLFVHNKEGVGVDIETKQMHTLGALIVFVTTSFLVCNLFSFSCR
jgi:hypothetical protein